MCKTSVYGNKCTNIDCQVTSWSAWSNCRCGYTDPKSRTRSVSIQPVGGGKACPATTDSSQCTMVPCPCTGGYFGNRCENRHCVLSDWTVWTTDNCGLANANFPGWTTCHYQCPNKAAGCTPPRYRSRHVTTTKVEVGSECSTDRSQSSGCGFDCFRKCVSGLSSQVCAYWKA